MRGGIYTITSPSGKVYVGQARNISTRWSKYKNVNSSKDQSAIYNSFLKYGVSNHIFRLVHELPIDSSQETRDQYEILYWEQFKNCGIQVLNIRIPGSTGPKPAGWKHTPEARMKISLAKKGKPSHLKGTKRPFKKRNRKPKL